MQVVAANIFSPDFFNDPTSIRSLTEDVFAASIAPEEGIYLQARLLVLAPTDSVDHWHDVLHIATLDVAGAFADEGLSTVLRRHAPVLRSTDYGFIHFTGNAAQLVAVAATKLRGLDRDELSDRLRRWSSVLVEVFGPSHLRFDNGSRAMRFEKGQCISHDEAERDDRFALQQITTKLGLPDAMAFLTGLVETLRLAQHGALYIVTDDTADLRGLFENSISVDWTAIKHYVDKDAPGFEPFKIIAAYAGFGMMDGAVVLGPDLSLRRYRAYYKMDHAVEGGGRSRAFGAVTAVIESGEPGIIAAIKLSTDGDLEVTTGQRLESHDR